MNCQLCNRALINIGNRYIHPIAENQKDICKEIDGISIEIIDNFANIGFEEKYRKPIMSQQQDIEETHRRVSNTIAEKDSEIMALKEELNETRSRLEAELSELHSKWYVRLFKWK